MPEKVKCKPLAGKTKKSKDKISNYFQGLYNNSFFDTDVESIEKKRLDRKLERLGNLPVNVV